MKLLSGSQKRSLKSQAHHLKPVVLVGRNGITDSLIEAVGKALDDHELIKIKFLEFKDEKKDLIEDIVSRTASSLVALIGNMAILFRQNKDVKKRRIVF
ncbi:MAG TPA: ribosome assembly RNA-binding protein YhbY [Spirochaetota bacterium]|nr:ribosome assembly RNA-binding protein YhbY [Spirochaetota bacterium]HPC42411.1 ribosome assembly RNA-binding protein YhbY [Spirochaetota bacterium]HPL16675.1 ribosome assembly RNA-binding protein YhbY [Spirochaetota bacterium]HQF06602.1 ribosome assembly RNA-binding protein YhbY [Spirochaetota bacterium]HQH95995.1 ribosome assembly RNA-binding protein YhbY [Spirochaetota bacterium]